MLVFEHFLFKTGQIQDKPPFIAELSLCFKIGTIIGRYVISCSNYANN